MAVEMAAKSVGPRAASWVAAKDATKAVQTVVKKV
jgi:hypothetical protein